MPPTPTRRRGTRTTAMLAAAAVGPLALLGVQVSASAAPAADPRPLAATRLAANAAGPDRTSAREARRVDRVPTPKPVWGRCTPLDAPVPKGAQCATVRVPLDYDDPKGPQTTLGIARIRAAKPAQRIGTLFVNPGGPGGSASEYALSARNWMEKRLLDRFDIVGVDPRGIARSENLRCFTSSSLKDKALRGFAHPLPATPAVERAYLASGRALAHACGTTGRRLASSMSTAQVARDMDVVRRAVGDRKLTYLGFSYGSQLGQVYANLFPDRVRALAVDGVVDPVAWTTGRGDAAARSSFSDRGGMADAAHAALRELMARCDRVGKPACAFAGSGNSMAKLDQLAARVRRKPITYKFLSGTFTVDYADFVQDLHTSLYDTKADFGFMLADLQAMWTASNPKTANAGRTAAARVAVSHLRARQARRAAAPERYDNSEEVWNTVGCTDSVNPRESRRWIAAGAAADRRAPYFGRLASWATVACAGSTWTARDEDRYLGPFTRRTAAPLLIIGNYHDPATSYLDGAVPAAELAPNSRLLTSDSWGHTAYGTSECATQAIGNYLIRVALPAKGTRCVGPQPFDPPAVAAARAARSARPAPIDAPVRPAP